MSVTTPTANEAASGFVNSRAFEWFARAGFVARGLVYGIIGILALKLAIGSGGKTTDQGGAMRTLAQQPLGRTMLLTLAVGLAGYAMWRFTRAALGRGPEGSDKGFDRVAALASGLVYSAFFVLAIEILLDARGGPDESEDHHRRRSQLARRPAPGRVGGPGLPRSRLLPGVPRHHAGLPPGLEDRGDAARGEEVRRPHRHGRASRTGSRLRARRRVSDQGCGAVQRQGCGRARRRARQGAAPDVRSLPARSSSPAACSRSRCTRSATPATGASNRRRQHG